MFSSLILFSSVVFGIIFGKIFGMFIPEKSTEVILYAIVIFVGLDLSKEKIEKRFFKDILYQVLMTIIGTYAGAFLVSLFTKLTFRETFLVSSGYGWYSLSGIMITQLVSPYLGTISFLSNIFREIYSILLNPILSKFSVRASISVAGATSMDTLLGVISSYGDKEDSLVCFSHGFIVSLLVPVMINLFYLLFY